MSYRDAEWLRSMYVDNGLSTNAIARIVGRDRTDIMYWMRKHHIPMRSPSERVSGSYNSQYGVHRTGPSAPYYGHHHTDETKRKMSEYRRGRRRPPRSAEWCEKLRVANTGKRLSDEHRRKISDANRGERNPMYGVHLTGDKNPNWQGGKSFEPYCSKFSDSLKIRVREKFGRRCYLCGKHESGNVQPLCVHHVDYNKNQGCGHSWSLVPLCHSCHSKTNHNRWYWFNLLSSHWASCWIGSFVGGSIDP